MSASIVTKVLISMIAYGLTGCTAAAFATEDGESDDAALAADSLDAARPPVHDGPARRLDLAAPPDAAPDAGDVAVEADAGLDAVTDTRSTDTRTAETSDAKPCLTYCIGSAGPYRRLGQTCLNTSDCCSWHCVWLHPGDGTPGICQPPDGPAPGFWCGGTLEWCNEAYEAGGGAVCVAP